MSTILEQIAHCVEVGKINKASPFPPDMRGQDGADELTRQAIEQGVKAQDILSQGLVIGMEKIGIKFRANQVFVPQVLMSAKAMNVAMAHLKSFFQSGEVKRLGVFVVGTVAGDLHDIGKNIVAMMVEGNGWEVIDLGVDVKTEAFMEAVEAHPGCSVGLSALLTTTLAGMEDTVKILKAAHPEIQVAIGGAPVNDEFARKIGADCYSPDPQGVVEFLKTKIV